ncbi:MAG: hypothetical protein AB8F26_05225 [Phycisphaerales bacterium]
MSESRQVKASRSLQDEDLLRGVLAHRVVLLTGPSGSGKSQAVAALCHAMSRDHTFIHADPLNLPQDRCAFDAVGATPGKTIDVLSAAGLAEPALWVRPVSLLSVGERARLALATAMAASSSGDIVVCDEFASNLDRVSAAALSHTAARWARRTNITLIAAAAHEDLPKLLDADVILRVNRGSIGVVDQSDRPTWSADEIRIEPGTMTDYHELSSFHYLGGRPATIACILRAMRITSFGEILAGVLVVSSPTLNGGWRKLAWPGRYESVSKRENAERINHELRCISRVIVEPRSRGIGVASSLVRSYLADPLTPSTEAVAAMGGVSPFFRAAGMIEYRLPRAVHDSRLLDALIHAGVGVHSLIESHVHESAFIARELSRWAKHARIRIEDPNPIPHLARHAVCRLLSRPRAYAHTRGGNDGRYKPR